MAKTQRQDDEPTRSRRVRAALAPFGRASAAATACILWVGLALPGLQLLPGAGGFGDRSIAISLQSALLGIDNGYASTPEARRAIRALGLAVINQSAGPRLRSDGAVSFATALAESIRTDTVDTTVDTTLVANGPHNRPSAGGDAPDRTSPPHGNPAEPNEPNEPTPRGGGGGTPSPQSKPPSGPAKSAQSITFNTSPAVAVVGGSYGVGASASSGLPVSFSLAAGSSGVCTISGATVSFVGTGTCTVRANQAGNANYLPAPQVTQSVDVDDAVVVQTISFTSMPPSGAHVGDPDYHVSAKASSGLPVEFGAESDSAGICKVTGVKVHLVAEGTCTINATQKGNSKFLPAPPVLQSFSIGTDAPSKSVQSINFTSTPPIGPAVGGTYGVSATASSGLNVAYSAAPSSAGVCTVAGSTVSLVGTGTCTVRANQAGNASYLAAPQAQQAFLVGLVGQTIAFSSTPPSGAAVGGPAYTVAATSSSGLPVVFSANPSSASVCTVSGSTVSLTGAGTCTVDADQSGDATHGPAPQVQQSFTIGGPPSPSVQSISFTSSPPSAAVAGGPAYAVSASASSGLAVTFSVSPSSAGVCTVSGSTVSPVGVGTCTVRADQAGNASYQPAPQVWQSFAVGLAPQTTSFTSSPPSSATVGDPDYVVGASATSGLAVVFSAAASSAGICTVSGSTVSFVAAGTCTINADQPGDSTYDVAPRVQQSFAIGGPSAPSVQSISFTSAPPSGAFVGGPSYTVSASASSGLPVSFSIDPASSGVCTLSGATVSFGGSGTCTIHADQSGNSSYEAATTVSQSFTVGLAGQTISFTSAPPGGAATGGPTYTVTAAASSGLGVTFSSGSPLVCSVSGSTVSFLSPGTCTVLANQAGNASYLAAPQVSQSFAVAPGPQAITFTTTPPSGAYAGGPTYTVAANASSGLTVTFSSGSPSVCGVSGSTVSFTGGGTCVVRANQSGNASYQPAPQVQQAFTVVPPPSAQTITFTSSAPGSAVYLGPNYNVSATASSGLPVSFTVSGTCTLSGSAVVMAGAGTCTVYANQSGSSAYLAAPQVQQTFSIAKRSQTITFPNPGNFDKNDPPFPLSATSSSGLAVTYTVDPSSSSICSVSGNMVTPLGDRGDCIVYANQAGDANYLAAPQVTKVITIKNHTPG
ncbi:MAG: hypothetical protein ABI717_02255 [Actinomycetota bacterium]